MSILDKANRPFRLRYLNSRRFGKDWSWATRGRLAAATVEGSPPTSVNGHFHVFR